MNRDELTIVLLIVFVVGSSIAPTKAVGDTYIDIFVIDESNGKPLGDSIVILFDGENKTAQVSDTGGHCSFIAPSNNWYHILVFKDDPSTPGCDYVPSVFSAYLPEVSVTWVSKLLPGATVYAKDDAHFLNVSQTGSFFLFTVANASSGEPLSLVGSLVHYGYGFPSWGLLPWEGENWQPEVLGLDPREIIVPASMSVAIRVRTLAGSWRDGWFGHEFTMDNDGEYYDLAQGELFNESLSKYSLRENFVTAEDLLNSTINSVSVASTAGFYVTLEREDLNRASSLIETAREFYRGGDYPMAHSYLREAYLTIANVDNGIKVLFDEARSTSSFAPILFATTAVILGFFLSENVHRRLILSLTVLAVLLAVFYFFFPGRNTTNLLLMGAVSTSSAVLLHLTVPILFSSEGEREEFFVQQPPIMTLISSIFSIAKRNLKRKKLRSILLSVNLSVLVFAFIVLTSVSAEFGLLSLRLYGKTAPTEGVLIRGFGSLQGPASPLPPGLIEWLYERPEVQVAVPKLESIPKLTAQANLTFSNGTGIPVFGILGIIPSLEKSITGIQDTVISGRFLEDNMTKAIMLSEKAADRLGAQVGDYVTFYSIALELVATFDDEKIGNLLDLDGSSVLPQKLSTAPFVGLVPRDCSSDEVVITNLNTALMLPNMMIGCVDVKLEENEDVLAFSKLLVLNRGFDVWAATAYGVFYVRVGRTLQSGGLLSVLPLLALVLLSVGLHFLGAARERKNEIFSMSSVGVNPTQITIVFIAEAIIVGVISGSIGYLSGLSSYRILSYFSTDLLVRQKVSIAWGLLGIFLTTGTAVLASIVPALRASAIVTPSLRRKWSVRAQGREQLDGTWVFTMPVKIPASTISFFSDFLERRLRARVGKLSDRVGNLRFASEEKPDYSRRRIQFRYISGEIEGEGFTIDNEIDLVKERDSKEYSVLLKSRLVYLNIKAESRIHENISFLRRLILEWATLSLKIATPEGYSPSHLYTLAKTLHPTAINLMVFSEDPREKILELSSTLHREGEPIPQFNLIRVDNPQDVEETLGKVREAVREKDVNLACVNGGPENICSLLAVEAQKKDMTICYVWDDRSLEEQRGKPFEVGKVIKLD